MKKNSIISLVCMFALLACNKEVPEVEVAPSSVIPALAASFEDFTTNSKATLGPLNGNVYPFNWQSGDAIGVRVYASDDAKYGNAGSLETYYDCIWNLNLEKGSNVFEPADDVTGKKWGYAAFFPKNNVSHNVGGDGNMYFYYQPEYNDYASGSLLSPMIADLSGSDNPTSLSLYHVGGTVKVVLNNVPSEADRVSLTVSNQNIVGWSGVSTTSPGTTSISAASLSGGNTVTLVFGSGSSTRDGMVFYFPVPVLTAPTIAIALYNESTLLWSKSAASAQPDVPRGGILDMPELTVSNPVYLYVLDETDGWGTYRNLYVHNGSSDIGASWPGVWSRGTTEIINGHSYVKFTLPAAASNQQCTFIFNNGNNNGAQVELGAKTVGTSSIYYRTDGLTAVEITDTEDIPNLYESGDVRIWARPEISKGEQFRCHAYYYNGSSDVTLFGTWWGQIGETYDNNVMTWTSSKYNNYNWYYISIPASAQTVTSGNVIFHSWVSDSDGDKQTATISNVNFSESSHHVVTAWQ